MAEINSFDRKNLTDGGGEELFIVLCTSGFERIANAKSALMFASLAASANYKTIVFCVQMLLMLWLKVL